MRGRLRGTSVTRTRAVGLWFHEHPGPVLLSRPASQPALESVERSILDLEAAGASVPYRLIEARDRLRARVDAELAVLWAEARQRYEEDERVAFEAIDASVARTRGWLDGTAAELGARQLELRTLVAEAEQAEEAVLARAVAALTDPAQRDRAGELLGKMADGRRAALAFADHRWSRYGTEVSQRWTAVRVQLLAIVRTKDTAPASVPPGSDDDPTTGPGETGDEEDDGQADPGADAAPPGEGSAPDPAPAPPAEGR